ncbi:MAG: ribonuclease P protein component [Elusimicrobiota bacterium]
MNQRFRKKNRLGKDTSKVVSRGKRRRFGNIVLFYRPGKLPRLSVIIGKKVGNSVTRNRLKRWTREIFRKSKNKIKNYDIAINYKPGSADYKFPEVEEKLLKLWRENKLLKD